MWVDDAVGVPAFLNVMVWPFTFRVELSWISVPSVLPLVVRCLVRVDGPEPLAVVRPRFLNRSVKAVMFRSPPVELWMVVTPAVEVEAVWPELVETVATPFEIAADLTPLARSIAVSRSPPSRW